MWAAAGHIVQTPFPRISYADAMLKYGSDKPDLRPGMEIADVSSLFAESPFSVFRDAATGADSAVRGFAVAGGATASRKQLDEWTEQVKQFGASGSGLGATGERRHPEFRAQGGRRGRARRGAGGHGRRRG